MNCLLCGILVVRNREFDTDDLESMKRHFESVHMNIVPNRSGRRCPLCQGITYNILLHLDAIHQGMKLEDLCHAIALGVKP